MADEMKGPRSLADLILNGLVSDEADEAWADLVRAPIRGELPKVFYVPRHPPGWMTNIWNEPLRGNEFYHAFIDDPVSDNAAPSILDIDPSTAFKHVSLIFESPNCGRVMVEEVTEFQDFGPADRKGRDLEIGTAMHKAFLAIDIGREMGVAIGLDVLTEDGRILEIKTYRPGYPAPSAWSEPIKEVVALDAPEPFHHQVAQRPWSTPNRKRFKRANRRRK